MHQNKNIAEVNNTVNSEKGKCCGRCGSGAHKSVHGKAHGKANEKTGYKPSGVTSEADMKNRGMSGDISGIAAGMYRGNVMTDPQGSYTGRPADITEVPVQDADDL